MLNQVEIEDIIFEKAILASEIKEVVSRCAKQIIDDYKDKEITFLVVLNGAFVFAADLLREFDSSCLVYFIKVSSYQGMESTNQVQISGLPSCVLEGKDVVIIEDIVDSGLTMQKLLERLQKENPASLEVCTLFFKPENFKGDYNIKYIGKSIENDFIVGYGLDFNDKGRNLANVYQRKKL
jgi:hypoxanthine phosphoribosyltransferase